MFKFLIDTADERYIKNLFDRYNGIINFDNCIGVTTNPNAIGKLFLCSKEEWKKQIEVIEDTLSEYLDRFEIHTQVPHTCFDAAQLKEFCKFFNNKNLVVKLPPQQDILQESNKLKGRFNVTGITDSLTAIKCSTFKNVQYISFLLGRMDERGLKPENHIRECLSFLKNNQKIISGSMRTIDGLIKSVYLGTIPTIGERVWNELMQASDDSVASIFNLKFDEPNIKDIFENKELIQAENRNLSKEFFEQMNKMGECIFEAWDYEPEE